VSFQYANCNRECDCCDALPACTQHDAVLYREEIAEVERLVAEQHPPKMVHVCTCDTALEERVFGLEADLHELRQQFDHILAFFNRVAQGLD